MVIEIDIIAVAVVSTDMLAKIEPGDQLVVRIEVEILVGFVPVRRRVMIELIVEAEFIFARFGVELELEYDTIVALLPARNKADQSVALDFVGKRLAFGFQVLILKSVSGIFDQVIGVDDFLCVLSPSVTVLVCGPSAPKLTKPATDPLTRAGPGPNDAGLPV